MRPVKAESRAIVMDPRLGVNRVAKAQPRRSHWASYCEVVSFMNIE
jgi:hypothetical protein